jgi:hypothetical protein
MGKFSLVSGAKFRKPLTDVRGSESASSVCEQLPSHDRKGVVGAQNLRRKV